MTEIWDQELHLTVFNFGIPALLIFATIIIGFGKYLEFQSNTERKKLNGRLSSEDSTH